MMYPVVKKRSPRVFNDLQAPQKLSAGIALVFAMVVLFASRPAQATNVTYTLSATGATNWSTGPWTPAGPPNAAGDLATYHGATSGTTTLDTNVTIGVISDLTSSNTWTVASNGVNSFTLDGTGLTAGNNPYGIAGEAALALTANGSFNINPNITIANTDLGIGTNGNSQITINGAITASTNQTINIRGGGSGGIVLNGNIGQSGANITISNANPGTSKFVINGALGTSVTSVIQNSATASMVLTGANTNVGTTTLTQGSLTAQNLVATNVLTAFGTSSLLLNGGTLTLNANGTGNSQTIVAGNNVTVGGNVTISVDRLATTSSNVIQFNNLSIGADTLTVTGGDSYSLQFAGTTTLTDNANFNTVSANLTLGAIVDGGNNFGITKLSGVGSANTLTINGASTYTGATILVRGVIAVNGAAGALANTSAVSVTGGGTLQLGDAANGLANRINTAATLTLGGTAGGGTLQIVRGATPANSQSFASLIVAQGGGTVTSSSSGGAVPTVTFSGANPYLRSVGGIVNFSDASVTVAFTNAPSGAANVNSGILIGAVRQGNDFVLAQAGNLAIPTYTANTWASGNKTNVTASNDFSSTPGLTTDALRFNTAGNLSVTLAGVNTIQSGGILVGSSATSGTLTGGSIQTGLAGGDLWVYLNGKPLTINSVISDNATSGLTLGGANASSILTITAANTYAGPTSVDGGVLQIGNGGTTGDLGTSSSILVGTGATLNYNRNNSYTTPGSVSGGGTVNSNNATGTLVLNQSGAGLALEAIGGVSGATIVFGGDGTGVTSLGDPTSTTVEYLKVAGENYVFNNGTVNLLDNGRGFTSNIVIAGGTLNVVGLPFSISGVASGTQTFTISSGALIANSSNGVSGFNGAGGAGQPGTANSTFIGTQTGGIISATNSISRFDLGSGTTGDVSTYNMSGGIISQPTLLTNGMHLGADATGSSVTTFNFSGGKILEGTIIGGSQGAGAKQSFVWTGGTLATFAFDATNLTGTAGTAVVTGVTNTLTNGGGILAPGDIGTAGKTLITGNYAVSSPNAVYAVDIGGATAASTFQSGAGFYDYTDVIGNTTLGGRLNFSLINGYTPANNVTTLYKILTGHTTAFTITGAFTNQVVATGGNIRVVGADGLTSFLLAINNTASAATIGGLTNTAARSVDLGGYQAGNSYTGAGTAWDAANAASWTNFDPGSTAAPATQASNAIAQFADGTVSTGTIGVSLSSTRNIQGIQFASASTGASARDYVITQGGGGAIILDNNSNSAAATIADSSTSGDTNEIDVPITLNSNLAVSVTNAATTLSLDGAISEATAGTSLTMSGAGTLVLAGLNTYTGPTNVNSGALEVNGSLASGPVTVAGALGGSGSISGTVTVSAGGSTYPSMGSGTATNTQLLSNVIYNSLSTAKFQVDNAITPGSSANAAPTNYDRIAVAGNNPALQIGAGSTASQIVPITGSSSSGVTLQLNMTDATFGNLVANEATPSNPYVGTKTAGNAGQSNYFVFTLGNATSAGLFSTLTIVEGLNTLTGTIYYAGANDQFSGAVSDGSIGDVTVTNGSISQEFAISYIGNYAAGTTNNGNDVVLTPLTAVPEPGTWGMILGGFGMLIGIQRFRRRRAGS